LKGGLKDFTNIKKGASKIKPLRSTHTKRNGKLETFILKSFLYYLK
jgi:hypothetical protein